MCTFSFEVVCVLPQCFFKLHKSLKKLSCWRNIPSNQPYSIQPAMLLRAEAECQAAKKSFSWCSIWPAHSPQWPWYFNSVSRGSGATYFSTLWVPKTTPSLTCSGSGSRDDAQSLYYFIMYSIRAPACMMWLHTSTDYHFICFCTFLFLNECRPIICSNVAYIILYDQRGRSTRFYVERTFWNWKIHTVSSGCLRPPVI
jgi:hypothetical protein